MNTFRIGDDVTVLNDQVEVPGLGFLPVNAFLLHAQEPVVVDTGLGLPDRDFVGALSAVIDPSTVRWIWLTHPDRDHTGGLFALLEAAPQARVVTTFLGVGLMSTERPLPLDRVYLLNPGQALEVGDRTLHAFRPPLFDSPATVGFYDDSPWVHNVDTGRYLETVRAVQAFDSDVVLSTHLPPAIGLDAQLSRMLADAPGADPFVGPDQHALEAMLASFQPDAAGG